MIVAANTGLALLLAVVAMGGWGLWANARKEAGRARWPFGFFWWDFALGVVTLAVMLAFSLGSLGAAQTSTLANFRQAASDHMFEAIFSGAVFSAANVLFSIVHEAAGPRIADPVCFGVALPIAVLGSFAQYPEGDAGVLAAGVALLLAGMALHGAVYTRPQPARRWQWRPAALIAAVAGLLMGFSFPELIRSLSQGFTTVPIEPGYLTPYSGLLCFAGGALLSHATISALLVTLNRNEPAAYLAGGVHPHLPGLVAGAVWMAALASTVIASGALGPGVAFALSQGAGLVAVLWYVYREHGLVKAGAGVRFGLFCLVICYVAGLVVTAASLL